MAPHLVWREGLLPLARNQVLQNARPRAALALPRLHQVPGMPRSATKARCVALFSFRGCVRENAAN